MTPNEVAAKLQHFNDWRRGHHDDAAQPDPREIGEAIDAAIAMIDRLESAESYALEQARLNGMGSEREAALMAKLEAAEKSDAESIAMYRKARDERDALRAKIEQMEKQEPIGWLRLYADGSSSEDFTDSPHVFERQRPLYALPGAKGEEK